MNTKKTNNRNGSSENLTSNDDDYLKQIIFEEYLKAVEVENSEFKLKNPDLSNIEFHLLQAIPDKALIKNIFFN